MIAALPGSRPGIGGAAAGQDVAVPSWLVVSIVLSVALTLALNLAIRLFPGAGQRMGEGLERLAERAAQEHPDDDRRVRVWVPWKLMLVVSLVGTVVLNLVLLLRR